MSDSRIDKVGNVFGPKLGAKAVISVIENSGLLVVDPTDPAVIDRVALALYDYDEDRDAIAWEHAPDWEQDEYRRDARAVLAALGGDR